MAIDYDFKQAVEYIKDILDPTKAYTDKTTLEVASRHLNNSGKTFADVAKELKHDPATIEADTKKAVSDKEFNKALDYAKEVINPNDTSRKDSTNKLFEFALKDSGKTFEQAAQALDKTPEQLAFDIQKGIKDGHFSTAVNSARDIISGENATDASFDVLKLDLKHSGKTLKDVAAALGKTEQEFQKEFFGKLRDYCNSKAIDSLQQAVKEDHPLYKGVGENVAKNYMEKAQEFKKMQEAPTLEIAPEPEIDNKPEKRKKAPTPDDGRMTAALEQAKAMGAMQHVDIAYLAKPQETSKGAQIV